MNKWLDLLKLLAPIIIAAVPAAKVLAPFTPLLITGITEAEQLINGTAETKKAHVMNLVDIGTKTANQVAGKVLVDPVETQKAADEAIDTIVAVTNLVHQAHQ